MIRFIATMIRLSLVPAFLLVLASPAAAGDCTIVDGSGRVVFDPDLGGFVGPVDLDGDGEADATSTAFVLSLVPTEDGSLHAVTRHTFALTRGGHPVRRVGEARPPRRDPSDRGVGGRRRARPRL